MNIRFPGMRFQDLPEFGGDPVVHSCHRQRNYDRLDLPVGGGHIQDFQCFSVEIDLAVPLVDAAACADYAIRREHFRVQRVRFREVEALDTAIEVLDGHDGPHVSLLGDLPVDFADDARNLNPAFGTTGGQQFTDRSVMAVGENAFQAV